MTVRQPISEQMPRYMNTYFSLYLCSHLSVQRAPLELQRKRSSVRERVRRGYRPWGQSCRVPRARGSETARAAEHGAVDAFEAQTLVHRQSPRR